MTVCVCVCVCVCCRANRDWVYHKEYQIWITRAPGFELIERTPQVERGVFQYFDVKNWKKDQREFTVERSKLESLGPRYEQVQSLSLANPPLPPGASAASGQSAQTGQANGPSLQNGVPSALSALAAAASGAARSGPSGASAFAHSPPQL